MILIIVAILFHLYVTNITYNRIISNGTHYRRPLNDIIHSNTHDLSKYSNQIDKLLLIFVIPFIINYKKEPIIHFMNIFSIIIILRSTALLMTDIPTSDKTCDPHNFTTYNLFFGHCSDKIFSGHTSFTLLTVLVMYKFKIVSNSTLILFALLQIIYSLIIILTRCHYSVDVLLCYYIIIPLYYCITSNNIF